MFKKQILKTFFFIGLILISFILTNCSSQYGYSSRKANYSPYYADKNLSTSPNEVWRPQATNDIPVTMNPQVKKWVALFNGNLKSSFSKWMTRIGYYGPTISKVLEKENAPQDLIYLAMIESGFNTSAYSFAHAVGPWQFIPSTGKLYGLNNGFFVDDRRDVIESTTAAARHLKDLYKVYGDWYLAFAAYNAGPGKVNRAIKRARTKDYWKLSSSSSRHLHRETKEYVPKILAALHIVKNYRKYGYSENSFGHPLAYERVSVPDATDFKALAKSAKTSTDVIASLNPSLVLGITPPGESYVYVPKGAADEFKRNYTMIPDSKRVSSLQYRVGNKETIASIAKKYALNAKEIARLNKLSSTNSKLKTGTIINIPADKHTLNKIAKLSEQARSSKSGSGSSVIYYKVRPGDTLSHIARKNGTSVKKIASWNNIKKTSRLRIGEKIKIYKAGAPSSPSAGSFMAYNLPHDNKRLSGVSHIIIQDVRSGSEFKPSASDQFNENVDVPDMIALADENNADTYHTAEQPAFIKTIQGEVIDTIQKEEEEKIETTKEKAKPSYHVIKSGETLSSIASLYNLNVSELKKLNNLQSHIIKPKQKLIVAKAGKQKNTTTALASDSVTKTSGSNSLYTVQPGDSLSAIAQKNKVYVAQIKEWNSLSSNNIKAGQKIKILKGSTASATQGSQEDKTVIYHKVRSGETLWSLSKRYQVKVKDIKKWNEMVSDVVKPNQKIKIIALKPATPTQA